MKFEAKIDHKKIIDGDVDSKFEAVAEGYKQWMEALKDFNKLNRAEQQEFYDKFAVDVQALLFILFEFMNPRTDEDREI